MLDEERIAAYLANLPALLTEDERAKLSKCARLIVRHQSRVAEVGIEAARRCSTTDAEEVCAREAVGRFFMVLLFRETEAAAVEMVEM